MNHFIAALANAELPACAPYSSKREASRMIFARDRKNS